MCALILIAIDINYSTKHSSKEQSGLSLAILNHQPLYKDRTDPSSAPASYFSLTLAESLDRLSKIPYQDKW